MRWGAANREVLVLMHRISYLSCALFLLGAWSSMASAESGEVTLSGQTMGTTYTVKAFLPKTTDRNAIGEAIVEELEEINTRMSTYLPDSEVSRFNRAAPGEWFEVSGATAQVVQLAQQISTRTEGAFDITVNPLVELWGFGPAARRREQGDVGPPTDAEIAAVLERVGFTKLDVSLKPPRLRKQVEGLQIDLSAIAKGYAVDRIWHVLNDWGGIQSYMIEVGGEVRVRDAKPNGEAWSIAIESPLVDVRKPELILAARNTAIASSGDYRNFFEHEGVLYSHTIDPRTGRPVSHPASGVTVTTERCAEADALATALMVLGPAAGQDWCEANQVAALFLSRTDEGVLRGQSSHFDMPEWTATAPVAEEEGQLVPTILVAILVFGLVIVAMSVGVLVQGKRLQGSCGGLAGMKDSQGRTICDACTNPSPLCSGQAEAESDEETAVSSEP